MKIEAKITIKHVEGWSVDWSNESAQKDALCELESDIREVLKSVGVDSTNIEIDLFLITQTQK